MNPQQEQNPVGLKNWLAFIAFTMFVKEKLEGKRFVCDIIPMSRCDDFFTKPLGSKELNIAYCRNILLRSADRSVITVKDILGKFVNLKYKEGRLLLPMLHRPELSD